MKNFIPGNFIFGMVGFKKIKGGLVRLVVYSSLVLAFIYGKYYGRAGFEEEFIKKLPHGSSLKKVNESCYQISLTRDDVKFLYVGKEQGYGGPLTAGIQLDSDLNIVKVHILEERETFGYIQKIMRKSFFNQFIGKHITDDLQVDSGIDAVSTCTVSSVAFTRAIQRAVIEACRKENLKYAVADKKWQFGKDEWLTTLVIVVGILAFYLKKRWIRYASLAIGLVIVGFITNASISITHFGRIFLGYFPDPQDHMGWYLLMSFFIGFSLFAAKNVYCSTLCPFHAVQIILSKLSGLNMRIGPGFQRNAKYITGFLLWISLLLIFVSVNPVLGSYEPFALLFSLEGVGIQWYLLPAALVGALFVPEYYCHFLCPVGRMHKWMASLGRKVASIASKSM